MSGFLIAAGVVIYLVLLVAAFLAGIDGWVSGWVVAFLLLVGGLGLVINQARAEDASGPCLKYETRYALVGKVLTPYRACVERGEWTK